MDRRKFITKKPVETDYATFRFLTFEEYIDYQDSLYIISLSTLNIYYSHKKILEKPTEDDLVFLKVQKDRPLREIVLDDELFLYHYANIIQKVTEFKEGYDIQYLFETEERFMEMRQVLMDMNLAKEEKAFYNEELQKGLERKKKFMSGNNGESQTAEDIITCIVASTSNSFDDVLNMSIYQAYAIYARVNAIKNYDTNILFSTVSKDVKVEQWSKHINLLKEDSKDGMKRNEFESKMGGF